CATRCETSQRANRAGGSRPRARRWRGWQRCWSRPGTRWLRIWRWRSRTTTGPSSGPRPGRICWRGWGRCGRIARRNA
ncbi:MAG: hypothetical protein AVDCRST_MAG73-1854, partial [uncultured Thermomicrobiales bacterium]